jgi:hypothetical protein
MTKGFEWTTFDYFKVLDPTGKGSFTMKEYKFPKSLINFKAG